MFFCSLEMGFPTLDCNKSTVPRDIKETANQKLLHTDFLNFQQPWLPSLPSHVLSSACKITTPWAQRVPEQVPIDFTAHLLQQ